MCFSLREGGALNTIAGNIQRSPHTANRARSSQSSTTSRSTAQKRSAFSAAWSVGPLAEPVCYDDLAVKPWAYAELRSALTRGAIASLRLPRCPSMRASTSAGSSSALRQASRSPTITSSGVL